VTSCTAVITTGKGFFDMFLVNWDVVTANGTNIVYLFLNYFLLVLLICTGGFDF